MRGQDTSRAFQGIAGYPKIARVFGRTRTKLDFYKASFSCNFIWLSLLRRSVLWIKEGQGVLEDIQPLASRVQSLNRASGVKKATERADMTYKKKGGYAVSEQRIQNAGSGAEG